MSPIPLSDKETHCHLFSPSLHLYTNISPLNLEDDESYILENVIPSTLCVKINESVKQQLFMLSKKKTNTGDSIRSATAYL